VLGWDGGKIGGFVSYEHRGLLGSNFVHLIPSVVFYLDQANLNLWYAQPVTGAQRNGHHVEYGINKIQGTASFYPGSDWGLFLRRDNVELTLGVQGNTFAGAGASKLHAGVGPVFGLSFLPMPAVGVNLFRGTVDSRGRYRVNSGLEIFYDRTGSTTLKAERRKYLDPNQDLPPSGGNKNHRPSTCGIRCTPSDRNLKTNIEPVDGRELLARLATVPVQRWNYKADDSSVRHIGPMAQDFHAAFNVGDSDKTINIVDGNGIALASIQALYRMVQEKDQRIAALEGRLADLERSEKPRAALTMDMLSGWPLLALVAAGGLFVIRRRKG
jgi:hypothetical protein